MRLRRSDKVVKMLSNARGIEVFTGDSDFIPDVISPEHNATCCQVMKDFYGAVKGSFVCQDSDRRFSLHINSNLWYEFSVAGMK